MREGGRITAACLKMLRQNTKAGVSTKELDEMAEEFIHNRGGEARVQGLPGLPRLDLRLAQRDDRARHSGSLPAQGGGHDLP